MKNIRVYIMLLLLFFAGDRMGAWVLQRIADQSQFRYSALYNARADAEIILMGNSRGLAFYEPQIEAITGKKTANLSYNGLPGDIARVLIQDYIDRYPAAKTLVIDITMFDAENDALLSGFLPFCAKSERMGRLIATKQPKIWWASKVSHLFKYNHEVYQRVFYHWHKTDKDWLLDRVIAQQLAEKAAENAFNFKENPYIMQQLAAIASYAHSKGIKLSLVVGPYFPGFQVKNLDRLMQDAGAATGLAVHNYQNAMQEHAFFGDFMHLNKKGSYFYVDILNSAGIF